MSSQTNLFDLLLKCISYSWVLKVSELSQEGRRKSLELEILTNTVDKERDLLVINNDMC